MKEDVIQTETVVNLKSETIWLAFHFYKLCSISFPTSLGKDKSIATIQLYFTMHLIKLDSKFKDFKMSCNLKKGTLTGDSTNYAWFLCTYMHVNDTFFLYAKTVHHKHND